MNGNPHMSFRMLPTGQQLQMQVNRLNNGFARIDDRLHQPNVVTGSYEPVKLLDEPFNSLVIPLQHFAYLGIGEHSSNLR